MQGKSDKSEQTVIFVHIPKTAGSTLYRIIDQHYRREDIYTVWIDGSIEDFKNLGDSRRSRIRVLRGHIGFGLDKYLSGPVTYFTILRDPIARVISYYNFVRRTPNHYNYDLVTANNMSLKDFVKSERDAMIANAQTRLLSGTMESGHELGIGECTATELEAAKRNLRQKFAVVGVTEAFDQTLLFLGRELQWRKLFYVRQNVTPNRARQRVMPQATLDAIEQANRLDIALYQYARSLFEAQVRQHGPSFTREVKSFQQANRLLSPLTYIYWGIQQISVRASVQKWIDRVRTG